jgi:hypothetical protein
MISGEGLRPFEGYEVGEIKNDHIGINVIRTLVDHIKLAPLSENQMGPNSQPSLYIDISDEELIPLEEQARAWVESRDESIFSATQSAEELVKYLPDMQESYRDFSRFLAEQGIPEDILSAMDVIVGERKYGFADMDLTGGSSFNWDNSIDISLPGIYSFMLMYKKLLEKYDVEVSEAQLFPIAFNSILSHELSHLLQQCYGDFVQNRGIDPSSIGIPLLTRMQLKEGSFLFNENIRINSERFAEGMSSIYNYNRLIRDFPKLQEKGLYDDLINRSPYRADLTVIMQGLRKADCSWVEFRKIVHDRVCGIDQKRYTILMTIEHLPIHNLFAYAYAFRDQELKTMINQTNQTIGLAA